MALSGVTHARGDRGMLGKVMVRCWGACVAVRWGIAVGWFVRAEGRKNGLLGSVAAAAAVLGACVRMGKVLCYDAGQGVLVKEGSQVEEELGLLLGGSRRWW